jgi:hypothetical protein
MILIAGSVNHDQKKNVLVERMSHAATYIHALCAHETGRE